MNAEIAHDPRDLETFQETSSAALEVTPDPSSHELPLDSDSTLSVFDDQADANLPLTASADDLVCYPRSSSLGGVQLKEKTIDFLNTLCRSLDSSLKRNDSTKLPSACKKVESEVAFLSESQLSHAGFFNDNDSVPNIEVKLSRCNSYSILLTDNDSDG